MTESAFIDTNIIIYTLVKQDEEKDRLSLELLNNLLGKEVWVSVQIVN